MTPVERTEPPEPTEPDRATSPLMSTALIDAVESTAGLVQAFKTAGYRLYLVGGAVRDLLAAETSATDGDSTEKITDLDFTTDAQPAEITQLVRPFASAVWTQGERFGTIGAKIGDRLVEITTHRAEVYEDTSRKPTVTFGRSIDDDLARRDFTINAIAVSLPDLELVDPYDGRADLAAGMLRTPLAPEVSFTDDPLRMLRAARFLARFGLEPAPELGEAAAAGADRLSIVSAERVQAELEKLLAVADPRPAFLFLERTGLLDQVVPDLGSVAADDRREALALATAEGSPLVRRAGLLLPLGARAAADTLRRLRYGRSVTTDTTRLVAAVPEIMAADLTDRSVRTIVDRIGLDRIPELLQLSDNLHHQRRPNGPNPFRHRMELLATTEDLADLEPPIGGGDLIERIGIEPGPDVGRAVAFLKERRLADGPMSEDDAIAAVTDWLTESTDQ